MRIPGSIIAAIAAIQIAALTPAASQTVNNFGQFQQDLPTFYFMGGVAILKRSTPDNGTFVAANPAGTPFLTGNDFKFGWDTGFDGAVGVRFSSRHALELRYLGINSDTSNTFVAPGAFIGAGFTGPAGTTFDSTYETRLQNWELNWRYAWTDQFTVLAGVRSISVRDTQTFVLNAGVATGLYDYNNRLRGGQIGFDWSVLPKANPFQIGLAGKIGVFRLTSDGGIDEFQGPNFIGGFGTRVSDNVLAGELGVSVGYRIHNNVLLRAGYQLLFIEDVGLASNNAAGSLLNPSLLNTNVYRDSLLYHGANLSVTINW